jgi:hypothetical protein
VIGLIHSAERSALALPWGSDSLKPARAGYAAASATTRKRQPIPGRFGGMSPASQRQGHGLVAAHMACTVGRTRISLSVTRCGRLTAKAMTPAMSSGGMAMSRESLAALLLSAWVM